MSPIQPIEALDGHAIVELRTCFGRPLLEKLQQLQATNGGKPDTVKGNGLAAMIEAHVLPRCHARSNGRRRFGIINLEESKRLV